MGEGKERAMAELTTRDPRELMGEHAEALREYARRALVQGESLSPEEEEDKAARAREFMALGSTFKLTERELVGLVFRGLFREARRCNCWSCRARRASGN